MSQSDSTSSSTSCHPTRPTSRSQTCTRRSKKSPAGTRARSTRPRTGARRKLAYEIGPHKEGTYVLEVITGSGELMKEIDRRLRVSDQVIRHLTVRVDEENRVIERARTLRKEDSQRRRVARGLPPERQPGEGPQRHG